MTPLDAERFWAKVDVRGPGECWPWKASTKADGYGQFGLDRRVELSHRVAFLLAHGRWPEPFGCHSCDNRPCCNPGHIFEGSAADNNADMLAKGRQRTGTPRKLTNEDVAIVRRMRNVHKFSVPSIAEAFGVHHRAIQNLLQGKTYRGVAS